VPPAGRPRACSDIGIGQGRTLSPENRYNAGRARKSPWGWAKLDEQRWARPGEQTQKWIEAAGITSGPLFRSLNRHGQIQSRRLAGLDVARILKKLAKRAGLDTAKYAGHSLRAGHATSAAIAGASEGSIMNQTGHRSVQMVRRYIREAVCSGRTAEGSWGATKSSTVSDYFI
jgi:integrase